MLQQATRRRRRVAAVAVVFLGHHTWTARMAVGTHVVSRNTVDKLMEGLFVAHLLALGQGARHDGRWSRA